MELLISSTLVLVIALLLLAWDATRTEKNPFVVLAGFGLLLFALLARLFSGAGIFGILTGVLTDAGIALLAVSALLMVRRRSRRERMGTVVALALTAFLLAGLIQLSARLLGAAPRGGDQLTTFLLELGPDDRIEEVEAVLARFGARYEPAFPHISREQDEDLAQVYLIHGDPSLLEALMRTLRQDRENVDHLEWNRPVRLEPPRPGSRQAAPARQVLADDPLAASQWALGAIRVHEAHALLRAAQPARKAVVAILDTGVDAVHEDLRQAFRSSPAAEDGHGHGTHCAGIAGAVAHNGIGIASLNWDGRFVEVAGYQALTAGGLGTVESIAQAILDAARDGVDVISLSLGEQAATPPRVMTQAVAFARRRGAIVVASAGNANQDARYHMPSNIEGVITVAAVDRDLRKARFSNTNTSLTRPIAAPGVDILSLKPSGQYVSMSGTSMATPMVAGLLGVLRALDPGLSAEDAYDLLHRTGTTVEDSDRVGRVINAEAALRSMLEAI